MMAEKYKNEHGTLTSKHVCETCGEKFEITPAADVWRNCMAPDCSSYDPHHDLDILFMSNEEIMKSRLPVSIEILRKRKSGGAPWKDMSSAPLDGTIITIKTREGYVFRASYMAILDDEEFAWCAEDEYNCPECWSDGVCWGVNADHVPSDPPIGWCE